VALEGLVQLLELLQLLLHEDVVLRPVGEEQGESGPLAGLLGLSDVLDDLVERGDARPSSDHVDVVGLRPANLAVPNSGHSYSCLICTVDLPR
jgi:hypothetical protein